MKKEYELKNKNHHQITDSPLTFSSMQVEAVNEEIKRFCSNCGRQQNQNGMFCASCGAKQGTNSCPTGKLESFCGYCGKKLSEVSIFCPECGTKKGKSGGEKNRIPIIILVSVLAVAVISFAFINSSSSLVGTWVLEDVTGGFRTEREAYMVFFSDGSGLGIDGRGFRWSSERGRVTMVDPVWGDIMVFDYNISGSTLTLTGDYEDGYTVTFRFRRER